MKRYLAVLVAAVAIGLAASVASAQALSVQRVCRYGVGGLTNDLRWETSAPFYIHISARAARYFAAQGGTFEGHPGFSLRAAPCVVAEAVAKDAMQAWESWPSNAGKVGVRTDGSLPRLRLGRFYCAGLTYATSGRTYEACAHKSKQVGTIVVQFVIAPATPGQ